MDLSLDAVWVGLRAAVTQALDALPSVQVRAMGFSGMIARLPGL